MLGLQRAEHAENRQPRVQKAITSESAFRRGAHARAALSAQGLFESVSGALRNLSGTADFSVSRVMQPVRRFFVFCGSRNADRRGRRSLQVKIKAK